MAEPSEDPTTPGVISRRTVVGAAAWATPAIALSVASPATATSLGTITAVPYAITADSPKSSVIQLNPPADNVTITISAEPAGAVTFPDTVTTLPGLGGQTPVPFATALTDAQVVMITAIAPGYAPVTFALPIEASPVTPVEPGLNHTVALAGPEVLEAPSAYTVTVKTEDGRPASDRPVTLTAPADTTFGGASTISGRTDSAGDFTATLSVITGSNAGERELIAESDGVTATLIVYIPSAPVLYDGTIGWTFTNPLAILLQGLILPDRTNAGLFQYRVLENLVTSSTNKWIRTDTAFSLQSSPWTDVTLGTWYTGGLGRTQGSRAMLGWARRVSQTPDSSTALSPRVTSSARLVLEFRRLESTPAGDKLDVSAGFYEVNTLKTSRNLATDV